MQMNENARDFLAGRESFYNLIPSNHHITLFYPNCSRNLIFELLILVFKMQLGKVLDNLIEAPFPTKGWTR